MIIQNSEAVSICKNVILEYDIFVLIVQRRQKCNQHQTSAKTLSINDGVKYVCFFAIGVAIDKSVNEKELLNWFHILIECKTMNGVRSKVRNGLCDISNLELSRAFKEVKITVVLSRFSHSASVLSSSLPIPYSTTLILTAR